jgi:predicted PhzF superfamily epimerase YddE/YHI9
MGVVDYQRIAVELGYSKTTFIDTKTPASHL